MIDPTVRPATAADEADLDRLEGEARSNLSATRGGPRLLELVPSRRGRWLGEEVETLVADLDGFCVGFLVGVPGQIWVVESVYVMPEARELGFGDELLAAAIASAKRAGSARLEATALPGDRETKNLYERAGVTAKAITVAVELNDLSTEATASQ